MHDRETQPPLQRPLVQSLLHCDGEVQVDRSPPSCEHTFRLLPDIAIESSANCHRVQISMCQPVADRNQRSYGPKRTRLILQEAAPTVSFLDNCTQEARACRVAADRAPLQKADSSESSHDLLPAIQRTFPTSLPQRPRGEFRARLRTFRHRLQKLHKHRCVGRRSFQDDRSWLAAHRME